MVGFPPPFCNDSSNSSSLGNSISSWDTLYIVYKLFSNDWFAGNFWETVGKKLCFFIVYFDIGLMKGSGSVSWDLCGCECSKCVSYVSYVFCNVSQFISYSFLVKFSKLNKVEFIYIALPMGKFHVQCSSSIEKDSCTYALFTLLSNLSIPCYFELTLLYFPPVLPHEVIYAFVLNSMFIAIRWSDTIPEAQSFIKKCFWYPYSLTSLRSIFHCNSSQTISFIYSLSMTRREPSLILVGLATRLSMVCGYL